MGSSIGSAWRRLTGDRRAFAGNRMGGIEIWATVAVIGWAFAFMLWQGVGFAITVGTVFGIWAILAVSLNLVLGFTGKKN